MFVGDRRKRREEEEEKVNDASGNQATSYTE
jgi:hypothetical protein